MSLDFFSILLAWFAGVLSILSPCVWPLVPIVMVSAAGKGRWGPLFLALGLSTAFALAGGILTFILLNLGLDPDVLRWVASFFLVIVGLILIIKPLADWVSLKLSLLSSRFSFANKDSNTAVGQFGVGVLLGFVWLPCVGPTLGAAIALASVGQDMVVASFTLFSFGMGTAMALVAAAIISNKVLSNWQPSLLQNVEKIKLILGWLLLLLGLMVFAGIDKVLETWAVQYLPDWAVAL